MQSVSRTRPKTARNCAISHKTTGPSAAVPAGSVERGSLVRPSRGRAGALVLMRNYRPCRKCHGQTGGTLRAQSVARDILPDSRTAKCLRIRAHDRDVQVWKSKKHKTASYGGLQTCGSVWVCPVCGAKVVERRRGEIQQAMAQHRACGGEVHLLTLTAPHTRFDVLKSFRRS